MKIARAPAAWHVGDQWASTNSRRCVDRPTRTAARGEKEAGHLRNVEAKIRPKKINEKPVEISGILNLQALLNCRQEFSPLFVLDCWHSPLPKLHMKPQKKGPKAHPKKISPESWSQEEIIRMSRNFVREIMERHKNVRGSRTGDDEHESGLRRRKVRVTACVRGILRLEYETRSPHLPILFRWVPHTSLELSTWRPRGGFPLVR